MGPAIALLLALQTVPTEPLVQKGTLHLKSRPADLQKDSEFSLWILLSVGVTKADPAVADLLKDVLSRPPESTRSAALQAMILQALNPVEHRLRIAHCAQFLVDNQCADGMWDAGKAVDPPQLSFPIPKAAEGVVPPTRVVEKTAVWRRRAGAEKGESVLSRWAAWGLLACHQSKILMPKDVAEKAAAAWRTGGHDPADVVSSLSIHVYLQHKDWKKDPDILKAVDRLAVRNPPIDPVSLFLLKRAMIHYDGAKLGGQDWWPDGVRVLAASQGPDGGWGTVEETCCAVFFLHVPRFPPMVQPDRK